MKKEQLKSISPPSVNIGDSSIENIDNVAISKQISEVFDIYDIPFLGCDFEKVYPNVADILPKEVVNFSELSFENRIACEVISAAICHQMNWDYLRKAVLDKTKDDEYWLCDDRLSNIKEEEVAALFVNYNKPERIRAKERCDILHEVGKMVCDAGGYQALFLDERLKLLPIETIRSYFLNCLAFSKDPKEKKLQLLLQKLSIYDYLHGVASHCRPAIDYHLIRSYLRRGLLYPKTKYAEEFISESSAQRKEATVGALRQLCGVLLEQIAWYTDLDICVVNSIEWNIGRSICTQDNPDCYLETEDAAWLRLRYVQCPFYGSCRARQNEKGELLRLNGPEYKGTSY
ncbi:MAG: hypothetical protein ACYDEX_17580 [Mobilitalea sp.]